MLKANHGKRTAGEGVLSFNSSAKTSYECDMCGTYIHIHGDHSLRCEYCTLFNYTHITSAKMVQESGHWANQYKSLSNIPNFLHYIYGALTNI